MQLSPMGSSNGTSAVELARQARAQEAVAQQAMAQQASQEEDPPKIRVIVRKRPLNKKVCVRGGYGVVPSPAAAL